MQGGADKQATRSTAGISLEQSGQYPDCGTVAVLAHVHLYWQIQNVRLSQNTRSDTADACLRGWTASFVVTQHARLLPMAPRPHASILVDQNISLHNKCETLQFITWILSWPFIVQRACLALLLPDNNADNQAGAERFVQCHMQCDQ